MAYEAAETSYRDFRGEFSRLLNHGGAAKPTAVLTRSAGGSYLSEFASILEAFKETRSHTTGQERVGYVRAAGYSPDSLVIDVCEDSRPVTTYDRHDKVIARGEVLTARLEIRRVGGSWKVWSGTKRKASSCDS